MRNGGTVTSFLAGALGEPGQRTFLLQLESAAGIETYLVEKAQVAALATEANELLGEAGFSAVAGELAELRVPAVIEFRVGDMQLSYTVEAGTITLILESVDDAGAVSYVMSPAALAVAARTGAAAVLAGRPLCPRCGLAMDPRGHHCPHGNGDLREHRP